jgi:hypothetical protein
MAPKSKQSEIDENPFLPPPVDIDRIPLADKDYLILSPNVNLILLSYTHGSETLS